MDSNQFVSVADDLWLLIASILVLFMQAGFLLLEGGRARSKNSINVAQKNITDLIITWVCFMSVGFYIMFGVASPIFYDGTNGPANYTYLHFFYQLGFCGTAVTIFAGAVAERMKFQTFLVVVAAVSLFVYPMVGRMVWGNLYNYGNIAWLANIGFQDFAGASVVHGVGAWCGLAGAIVLGPRIGRFDENGNVKPMSASNSVISLLGINILLIGWLGFNGGLISVRDPLLPQVILNTLSSAAFGALAGMILGTIFDKGIFNPSRICNGLLGGLVACTASANFMTTSDSVWIGFAGGALAVYASEILLHKFKLDDPVDVVGTHGIAGVFGTLMVSIVAPVDSLVSGSRLLQFGVQLFGIAVIFTFVSASTFAVLKIFNRYKAIRVTADEEEIGLNYTEHGESIGTAALQRELHSKLSSDGHFDTRLQLDTDSENAELADTLNQMILKNREARSAIEKSEKRFRQFAHTASDWLWETDKHLDLVYFSREQDKISSDISARAQGLNLLDFVQVTEEVQTLIGRRVAARQPTEVFEGTILLADNTVGSILVEVRGVPDFDAEGDFQGYRGGITDITLRKAAEHKAVFLSRHDELTGLPNRRALSTDLPLEITAALTNTQAVAVGCVDLDGFKAVNDRLGHAAGDIVLCQVAERMNAVLRHSDQVYRTGGDEFVVVFGGLSVATAPATISALCQRVIEEVSREYVVEGHDLYIGASVGVAYFPEDTASAKDLPEFADLALYAAKDSGKGCVMRFQPEMNARALHLLNISRDLRKAIANSEFYLLYQPLMDMAGDGISGFEALIRWRHPEKGEIPPVEFIGIAENLNLMDEIGTFVLDEACKFASSWDLEGFSTEPRIAVNVSPLQFNNPQFVKLVAAKLDKYSLPAKRLELEVTEDVLIEDFDRVIKTLTELRGLGVDVAIDDFGSGQTSLRYLSQFPISTLKIDRSFVKNLSSDNRAAEITSAIINLGHKLGLTVLAEGVEEGEQLSLLKSWHCDQVQGFLFSKPVDSSRVVSMLRDQRAQGSAFRKAG